MNITKQRWQEIDAEELNYHIAANNNSIFILSNFVSFLLFQPCALENPHGYVCDTDSSD
jgi:hypothetical protein